MIIQDGGAQESVRAGWLLYSPQTLNLELEAHGFSARFVI